MDAHSDLLARLQFGEFYWYGRFDVPWWGAELPVRIKASDAGPSARQLDALASVLSRRESVREEFAQAVYDYYQREVYDSFAIYDDDGNDIALDYAPRLLDRAAIWDLIEYPIRIWIPALEAENGIVFRLGMECRWDPEHGLGVRFEDWQITAIGGEAEG